MANSLKDLASSVDWGKMFSGQDARNALVGSALGGLVLGGAGLAADRDPEESRLSPVGDALMGALLGGVAGYGIPKGLAMFRDSGSLAPDGDTLKPNYLGWGLGGAGVGAGAAGLSIRKTLSDVAKSMKPDDAARAAAANKALAAYNAARANGASAEEIARRRITRMATHLENARAQTFLEDLRADRLDALRRGDVSGARAIARQIKDFKNQRLRATRGYSGITDLLDQTGRQGSALGAPSWLEKVFGISGESAAATGEAANASKGLWKSVKGTLSAPFRRLMSTTPRHYHGGAMLGGYGPRLSNAGAAAYRMLKRTGKWGAGGAAAALLLHKLLGPSSSDNFKK